jgi:hypothetical protein
MSSSLEDNKEIEKRERAVGELAEGSGVALEEVRGLFNDELTRLEQDAKVHTYLHVLAIAGVRALLLRQRTERAKERRKAGDDRTPS